MIQTCNDAYWENMPAVRDRTEGAPCGETFEDVSQSTLCPHEELAPAGPTISPQPVHLNWQTAWPHAVADVFAVRNTTDDPKAVTCEACLHAMGTQKQDPPGPYLVRVTRMGAAYLVDVRNPWGRGIGSMTTAYPDQFEEIIRSLMAHSGASLKGDAWSVEITYGHEVSASARPLTYMSHEPSTPAERSRDAFKREMLEVDFEELAKTVASDVAYSIFGAVVWLEFRRDKADEGGRFYYQVHAERPDTYTGEMGEGAGGKAYLSPHMIEDELVQIAWGLFQSYVIHEAREGFTYKEKRIFGPHLKVANLLEIADDTVKREAPRA